jgi:MFS family permease
VTPTGSARVAERRGLLLAFAAFGSFWGAWVVALPDLRSQTGVDDGQLGLALAAVALAALPTMPLAGRLVDRHGASRLLAAALLLFGAAAVAPAFATGLSGLVAGLVVVGLATGALDVFLNTAAAAWERLEGERVMSAAHGCFSLGVLFASTATGVARDAGAGPRTVLGVTALVLVLTAAAQPRFRRSPAVTDAPTGRRRLGPVLLLMGVLIGLSFLVEDAVQSWSALHLERTLDAPPWIGGLGPGLFAAAMAAGRFGAHAFATAAHDAWVVGGGALCLAAGVLLLALAPTAALALVGMTVAGAGVSVLSPTLFSAVGARSAPGRQGADLALVSATGYFGFVLGPPLVGVLSAATSLPTALASMAVLAGGIAVAGPLVLRSPTSRRSPAAVGRRTCVGPTAGSASRAATRVGAFAGYVVDLEPLDG